MSDLILPRPEDAVHKAWLYRALGGIYDRALLAEMLYFKGGTCAAMLGYLDRFSVDLDFDFVGGAADLPRIRAQLEKVFQKLGLVIADQSKAVPQYFLKYPAPAGKRNTLKIDVTVSPSKADVYEARRFQEIDRIITCQTMNTMMANKLVTMMDRYQKGHAIAGRDLYDIHHFFLKGYHYQAEVIEERTGMAVKQFFKKLIAFINKQVTSQVIDQDLNTLLPYQQFSRLRGVIKNEALMFLRDELKRL